jgi:hypothetical protein
MDTLKLKEIADIRNHVEKSKYIYWSNKEKKWIVTDESFVNDKAFIESFYQKQDIPMIFRQINKK